MSHADTALLLINLGTPESPEPSDVRPYLYEFLSDARVIDIPAWKRELILRLFVLPRRPKASGQAYEAIWTEDGSPLMLHSVALTEKVQQRLGDAIHVELAMRYGRPSIASALDRIAAAGIDRIVVFPLYPQYASSSTGTVVEKVFEEAGSRWNTPYLSVVPHFYDHPAYIRCLAARARPVIERIGAEKVLMSFHGLPERHCRKSDPSGAHCLVKEGCCDEIGDVNRMCYRAHCAATARALGAELGLGDKGILCFQSRFGKDPWIRPYTDETVRQLAKEGVTRAAILSPAFVADCLETLEELGMQAAEDFEAHGGEVLELVPALNAGDDWADTVVQLARETSAWIPAPVPAISSL